MADGSLNAVSGAAAGVAERLVASGGRSAGTVKDAVIDGAMSAATEGLLKGGAKLVNAVVHRAPGVARAVGRVAERGGAAGATAAESELVNLASPERTTHILTGDATGGGHLWPGLPGKTPFPAGWSGDQIMHHVSDIATEPSLPWSQQTGPAGSMFTKAGAPARFMVSGVRDGVGIKVILEPAGEGIVTAFPH